MIFAAAKTQFGSSEMGGFRRGRSSRVRVGVHETQAWSNVSCRCVLTAGRNSRI